MANNFVEEAFWTKPFMVEQEVVIAEVIDGHKLIDLENVVFDW